MEELFLFEALIRSLFFYDETVTINKHDIKIDLSFGDTIKMEIVADELSREKYDQRPSLANTMMFNIGKSYLFSTTTDKLLKDMDTTDLKFSIYSKKETSEELGTASVSWNDGFKELVRKTKNPESEKMDPVELDSSVRFKNNDKNTGIIEFYIRLTSFGNSIQTIFQVLETKDDKKYIFKNTKAPTAFRIERCEGSMSGTLPMVPILGGDDLGADDSAFKPLFFSPHKPKASVMVSAFKLEFVEADAGDETDQSVSTFKPPEEIALTPSYINQTLCGNSFCPVAAKFREFGLGPLGAFNDGLGAIRGTEKVHTTYKMSQSYGTMAKYGPYGVLARNTPLRFPDIRGCDCLTCTEKPSPNCGCLNADSQRRTICGGLTCPFHGMKSGPCKCSSKKSKPYGGQKMITNGSFNIVPPGNVGYCGSGPCPMGLSDGLGFPPFYGSQPGAGNETEICGSDSCFPNGPPPQYMDRGPSCAGQTCPVIDITAPSSKPACCGGKSCPFSEK